MLYAAVAGLFALVYVAIRLLDSHAQTFWH